ncbi:uncharacterized protein MONBRDRAFT_6768 [Monosiga brevicollis MX1]|uniref:Cystathionine gamma-synthase n=1 Tax=Monosiga brevicollis TaxID=81824 RepID=A9UV92_MONBE|nr:uncharacterized protein MONBRDRAFT_6768 [Monosiga brevicollis MX1]EDQ91040.1 predicted protein [Monosiga brevicollis MX1]|eukprot:XP_001744337.1 hypothetical protein [Monosiga brevicollis MX1]
MPHWQNVIDYEEGDPRVVEALHCGYPRFVYPPAVRRLITALGARYAGPQQTVLPCPSLHTALRVQQHLLAAGIPPQALSIQDVGFEGVAAVVMPDTAAAAARTYWQHMGEIVSARLAQRVLGHLDGGRAWDPLPTSPATDPSHHLRRHIAALSQQDPDHIQLFSTGMGAVTACTRMLRRAAAGTNRAAAKAVVLGFPYVDTLKQLQHPHLGPGAHFLPGGDLDQLRALAAREPLLAIYVETPSNPLLRTVDMDALRAIADAAEVPVVVDDSIANYCNVDVLTPGLADVQVSSLTKSFSGRGNVMGGAMILNPRSAHFSVLQYHANCSPEPGLYRADAEALLHNSVNLEARTARTNASAERLADFLIDHPAVAAVHYPKFVTPEFYERIRRPTATGYGGLMSIDLRQPARAAAVHDALVLPKGPGFGTNFSLLCPYTLLAHYYELDFARTHGVEKSLLRMWVGLEDPDQLIDTWAHALTKAD